MASIIFSIRDNVMHMLTLFISIYWTRSKMPVSILASGGMLMFVGGLMLFLAS
jgi:hypothetical protein